MWLAPPSIIAAVAAYLFYHYSVAKLALLEELLSASSLSWEARPASALVVAEVQLTRWLAVLAAA